MEELLPGDGDPANTSHSGDLGLEVFSPGPHDDDDDVEGDQMSSVR